MGGSKNSRPDMEVISVNLPFSGRTSLLASQPEFTFSLWTIKVSVSYQFATTIYRIVKLLKDKNKLKVELKNSVWDMGNTVTQKGPTLVHWKFTK